jgi:prepilin-type N-terminal cleavage/methylation domain-containing protein
MRWPARFRTDESGFTLVELMIGMAIIGLLIGAVGSALIVVLRTTEVTNKRMSQSHDVQITSAYLANDVQSASNVDASTATTNCSSAFTTLVTFTYSTGGHPTAVYKCGTSSNGETQVTRTFNNGAPIVIAHFAGVARPNVTVTYDQAHPTIPVSVTMTFTKSSDCTLDCTYTLYGSRRSFNPSAGAGSGSLPGDIVLLSTGTSSPLWVQGSCPDPGTTSGCIIDQTKTALPISDVQTTDWSPTPLWSRLRDADTTTSITSVAGKKTEARVLLAGVDPPDPGVLPTVEFHAAKFAGSSPRITLSLYDGSTLLTSQPNIGPINQFKSYDWTLTAAQAALIPLAAYAHLTLGFAVSNASGTDSVAVDGVAFDSFDLSAAGLLTIKGPLVVNSPLPTAAVRLTGVKTANKITIADGFDFQILNPGGCSGCNHSTVACLSCQWVGQQPWTNYQNSVPDPLQSLPAPPVPSVSGSCNGSGVCQPGHYTSTFSRTSNTVLNPGIYYFDQGMSITGSAALTCASPCASGVMIYIAGGSVTFAGSSSINLPSPSSGTYKGILMFQAHGLASEVKIAGNSGSGTTNVLGGIVYVPDSSQVTLATGSASLTAKAIVAQNIKVSSSVTIG